MEEKKRWRPTLTQYRELENENKRLKEELDALKLAKVALNLEREISEELNRRCDSLEKKLEIERSRSFWKKLFG